MAPAPPAPATARRRLHKSPAAAAHRGTTAAEAVFYTGNRYIGIDFAHPERYIFLKDLEAIRGKDAIILLHNQSEDAFRQYTPYFESFEKVDTYICLFQNEKINSQTIQIVAGKGYRGNWLSFGQMK